MGKKREAAAQMTFEELLGQDRWWKQKNGVMIRLDQMSVEHRLNLLALLRRTAPNILNTQLRNVWLCAGSLQGEMALDSVDELIDQLCRDLEDPIGWLEEQSLYRKLRQLVSDDLCQHTSSDNGLISSPDEFATYLDQQSLQQNSVGTAKISMSCQSSESVIRFGCWQKSWVGDSCG